MISEELRSILVCPETKQSLSLAAPNELERINEKIRLGEIINRKGDCMREPIEAALIREDGEFAYPVRNGIPIMLIDEAFQMGIPGAGIR